MSYKNPSRKQTSRLSTPVRIGVAAVAACFISAPVLSNPLNPTVVNGTAAFNQAGTVLTVTNSPGAIINWQKFSIQAGETTHFAQTSASSSVLNRVLSDPSAIYGTLSSNGRVWLVNPAGIMVGPGGRIDVAAFVASTLNISNADFLAGRNVFINDGNAKNVINQGEIRTPAGGSVYLIGSNVSNEGIITTPQGETILAAGATVSLIDSATPGVKVDITGAEGNATNLGTLTAEAGRIGIAGVIVRNSGQINASSVVEEGGRVFLKASQDAYVDGNGRIVTTGTRGGSIEVLGNRVAVMDNAEIDASGTNGGGRIMIGGDYQGKNPDIQNASITYFGSDATLKADATEVGDGGTVIVWADDTTRAYGSISARGGALGGDGGFVETSGKKYLAVDGIRVDTRAPQGQVGNWLLDPSEITISSSPPDSQISYGGGVFTTAFAYGSSTIYAGTISSQLAFTDVTIQTYGGTSGSGNITATGVSISGGAGYGLSLLAYGGGTSYGSISISGSNFQLGTGALTLVAGWDGATGTNLVPSDGTNGSITITDSWLRAGPVDMKAVDDISVIGSITGTRIESSGAMNLQASNISLYGGSAYGQSPFFPGFGAGVLLHSSGTQTVTATGSIVLQAGSANNTLYGGAAYGGSAVIWSDADQSVSANTIRVLAGPAGHDNAAVILAYGSQSISITGTDGLLELKGGGSAGSGTYNNYASIQHGTFVPYGGSGVQTINVDGGGSVVITAGSGDGTSGYYDQDCTAVYSVAACSGGSNGAQIENVVGTQTLNFTAYGSLTITGGSAGFDNSAAIANEGTDSQFITGSPNITLNGGSGGGKAVGDPAEGFDLTNDAGIYADGSGQYIYAGTLTINGGNATHGGAGISHDGASGFMQVVTTGDLIMTGGSSNAAHPYATPAAIHSEGAYLSLSVGGNLFIAGGSGSSGPAIIGSVIAPVYVPVSVAKDIFATGNTGGVLLGMQNGGGYVYLSAGYSSDGGNISLNGPVRVQGGDADLYARASSTGAKGNITQTLGSSITATGGAYGGDVYIQGEGSVTIAGSVTASNGYIFASAGLIRGEGPFGPSSPAGGSLSFGSNSIVQATSDIVMKSSRDVTIDGTMTSTSGSINIVAGFDGYTVNNFSSFGGDIRVAGTLTASSDIILSAYSVSGDDGNITQSAGSITATAGYAGFLADGNLHLDGTVLTGGGVYGYAGYSYAAGKTLRISSIDMAPGGYAYFASTGSASIGTINAPSGRVDISAGGAILDTNGSALNITADSIYLGSQNGGVAGGLAISMDTAAVSSLSGYVGSSAASGGISIRNFGAQPGYVFIDDSAASQSAINFFNSGDLTLDGNKVFSTSPIGSTQIGSGGILAVTSGISGYDINLAGATIDVNGGYVYADNNIQMAAGTINVNGGYVFAANNVTMVTPLDGGTINLMYGGGVEALASSGTPSFINNIPFNGIGFVTQNLSGDYGGFMDAIGLNGNISGLLSGNVTLRNGSALVAGDDITLVLSGANSLVELSLGSRFESDIDTGVVGTIYLDFLTRSGGGIMIDGVATTTSPSSTGSGFFVGNPLVPATPGNGLEITYATALVFDPCANSPDLCKPPAPVENPILEVIELTEVDPCTAAPDSAQCKLLKQESGNEFGDEDGNTDGIPNKIGQCSV